MVSLLKRSQASLRLMLPQSADAVSELQVTKRDPHIRPTRRVAARHDDVSGRWKLPATTMPDPLPRVPALRPIPPSAERLVCLGSTDPMVFQRLKEAEGVFWKWRSLLVATHIPHGERVKAFQSKVVAWFL